MNRAEIWGGAGFLLLALKLGWIPGTTRWLIREAGRAMDDLDRLSAGLQPRRRYLVLQLCGGAALAIVATRIIGWWGV
jgi:hypothetical protein